ncbi:MAG: SUMF1/EgtB/PvdO family nonheme iron enzyme [Chloroflexota bacterium]
MIQRAEHIDPRIELRDLLNKHLTLDDMITLCFDLGIDYENISGDIKRTKIENLIMQAGRSATLPLLIDWAKSEFPHLNWPAADWKQVEWDLTPFVDPQKSLYQGRPKEMFEPELVFIPAGRFTMGRHDGPPEEGPMHEIDLPGYWIAKGPLTNQAFGTYLWKNNRVAASAMLWDGNEPARGTENQPVTGLSWQAALDYCQWLSAETGRPYRLPTEAEWEKGIRGADGPDQPGGLATSSGIREWTATAWGRSSTQPDPQFAYPWRKDQRNAIDHPPTVLRVYRGGDNYCTARGGYNPTKPGPKRSRHGVRVVCDLN